MGKGDIVHELPFPVSQGSAKSNEGEYALARNFIRLRFDFFLYRWRRALKRS